MTENKKAPKPCEVLPRSCSVSLNESMKLLRSERTRIIFWRSLPIIALRCGIRLMFPEKNCCIHPPKRIEAVWFQHCSRKCELKRAENKVEAADGMWFNNNESNNWESDHSTYFGLHFILFEHLELLEHRATLTAGKTMLFCVVYSRKKFVLSGCQCLFSLILVGNHRKRVTHY